MEQGFDLFVELFPPIGVKWVTGALFTNILRIILNLILSQIVRMFLRNLKNFQEFVKNSEIHYS